MLLFRDYESMVVQAYRHKRANNALPLELIEPTPARLRDECLKICRERFERRDEKTLVDFFKKTGDKDAWIRIIERVNPEIFKSLVNFLKNTSVNTSAKNIELLAWLIGFEPRPLEQAKRSNLGAVTNMEAQVPMSELEVTIDIQNSEAGAAENKKTEPIISVRERVRRQGKKTIIVLAILVVVGIVIYLARIGKPALPILRGHETCMYWAEDHYQPVSCSQKIENAQVIALDSEKVIHFRKIIQPDTITDKAIGYVWYVRYRKSYEFYTSDGFHPNDPTLRLRPITEYIIRNHIHSKQ